MIFGGSSKLKKEIFVLEFRGKKQTRSLLSLFCHLPGYLSFLASLIISSQSQVPSNKEVQGGVLTCQAGFTYFLCFDNTVSKFRAKTVLYSVILEDIKDCYGRIAFLTADFTVEDLVRLARDGSDTNEQEQSEKRKVKGKSSKKSRSSFKRKKNQI